MRRKYIPFTARAEVQQRLLRDAFSYVNLIAQTRHTHVCRIWFNQHSTFTTHTVDHTKTQNTNNQWIKLLIQIIVTTYSAITDRLWNMLSVKILSTAAQHTHTHTRLTALCPGLPGWASTRKVKPIWILLKQETVSGSGISWTVCKSAPRSRQITTPAPHHSVFYRPDALPATQPTASSAGNQRQSTEGNKQLHNCRNNV